MRFARTALVRALAVAPAPAAVAHDAEAPQPETRFAGSPRTEHQLEVVRQATKRFRDVRGARRAGYVAAHECHEPGMPVHYDLHAWIWKRNPAGTFAMWNPRVECPRETR
jgi:hypothetical protein